MYAGGQMYAGGVNGNQCACVQAAGCPCSIGGVWNGGVNVNGGWPPGAQNPYWNQSGAWGQNGAYQQNMYAAAGGTQLQRQSLAEQFGVAGQNYGMYGGAGGAYGGSAAFMPGNLGISGSLYAQIGVGP
jgi:hypothetical protein